MPIVAFYPSSYLYSLWQFARDLATRDGGFTARSLRAYLYMQSNSLDAEPQQRRWALILLSSSLTEGLHQLRTLGLLQEQEMSAGASQGTRPRYTWITAENPRIRTLISNFSPLESLPSILRSIDNWLRQQGREFLPETTLRTLLRQQSIDGHLLSELDISQRVAELVGRQLLVSSRIDRGQGPATYYRLHHAAAEFMRVFAPPQPPLPVAEPDSGIAPFPGQTDAPGPSRPAEADVPSLPSTRPKAIGAAVCASLLQRDFSAAQTEQALWSAIDNVIGENARYYGEDPQRVHNLTLPHLLDEAARSERVAALPHTSTWVRPSPLLEPGFVLSIQQRLEQALASAARDIAALLQGSQAGTANETPEALDQALHELAARVGEERGLPGETVYLRALHEWLAQLDDIAPSPAARSPLTAQTVQGWLDVALDSGHAAASGDGAEMEAETEHTLLIELEPRVPNPQIERAASQRMNIYPPSAERFRLLQGGFWQRWDGQSWIWPAIPLSTDPTRPLKLVVVGEGETRSEHDDSNRVSGYHGDELARHLTELLPPVMIRRLSLLACAPGLGFVSGLLEKLQSAGFRVDDVVRRRGSVLISPQGRGWVYASDLRQWRHGPQLRDVVTRDADSGILTVTPEGPGPDPALDVPPPDSAGPLGAAPEPGESVIEGRLWRARLEEAVARIEPQAAELPLLEPLADGGVRLLDPGAGRWRDVATRDPVFRALATHLDQRLAPWRAPLSTTLHGMARAFSYSAGLAVLLQRRGAGAPGDEALERALRLHGELALIQFTQGATGDVAQLSHLALTILADGRTLGARSRLALNLGEGLMQAERGLGFVTSGASIGLDIYELLHAASPEERALFGTQLGFDASTTLLEGSALAAAGFGAEAVAGVAGPIGVVVGLIGFLTVSLLSIEQRWHALFVAEQTVEQYFALLGAAHRDNGCDFDAGNDLLRPRPGLVVDTLDLIEGRIVFGSSQLMASDHSTGVYVDTSLAGFQEIKVKVPHMVDDPQRAIVLRERLGLDSSAQLTPEQAAARCIMLPATPPAVIRYRYRRLRRPYTPLPDNVAAHPGHAVMLRLAAGGDFEPELDGMAIVELMFDYQPAIVRLRLGRAARALIAPALPAEVARCLSYTLQGAGGRYALSLASAVAGVRLETEGGAASRWLIDAARSAYDTVRSISAGGFTLALERVSDDTPALPATPVTVASSDDTLLVRLANGETWQLDGAAGSKQLVAFDAARMRPPPADTDALNTWLRARQTGSGDNGHVVIDNAPAGGRAFFDPASKRLLHPGVPAPLAAEAELVWLGAARAVYIARERSLIWLCDSDSRIVAQARLLFDDDTSRIVAAESRGDGLLLEQAIGGDTPRLILRYRLAPDAESLTVYAASGDITSAGRMDDATLAQALHSAAGHTAAQAPAAALSPRQLAPAYAEWLMLQTPERPPCWRRRDGFVLIPQPPAGETLPRELELVAVRHLPDDVFFLYAGTRGTVYRQGATTTRLALPAIARVLAPDATTRLLVDTSGAVRELAADGQAHLVAVTRDWFAAHRRDWWQALPRIGADSDAIVALPAITDREHKPRALWFAAARHRFVLAPAVLAGRDVRLVGFDAGGYAALFDAAAGTLYRQPPLEPAWLPTLLDGSGKLIGEVSLRAVPVLAGETLTSAAIVGGRIRADNAAGLTLGLSATGQPQLLAVDDGWLAAHPAAERSAAFSALAARYALPEVIALGRRPAGWYLPRIGLAVTAYQAEAPEFIGYHAAGRRGYYYDRSSGVMRYELEQRGSPLDRLYRDAWRVGPLLLLKGGGANGQDMLVPLLLDGVDTVWLAGEGGERYRIDAPAWQALRRIVIDDIGSSSLLLDFARARQLVVAERGVDLLLKQGDKEIVIRRALAPGDSGRLTLRLDDGATIALERLTATGFDRGGSVTLAAVATDPA
jgi:hypothetical protein